MKINTDETNQLRNITPYIQPVFIGGKPIEHAEEF